MSSWYILVGIFLIFLLNSICNSTQSNDKENFTSGTEQLIVAYDQIYPLDHPKYVTPQQKDFQIVLSEHSALDPNLQNRRPDIKTQGCALDKHCFSTSEWHALNYLWRSAPDVINSQVDIPKDKDPPVIYTRHNQEKVVPANSTAHEMRADLFDDIMIPDLFFKRRMVKRKKDPAPEDRDYATAIY